MYLIYKYGFKGYSLFNLFDRTKSFPGRERLKEWMHKPVRDINIITDRQNGIALAVRIIVDMKDCN